MIDSDRDYAFNAHAEISNGTRAKNSTQITIYIFKSVYEQQVLWSSQQ